MIDWLRDWSFTVMLLCVVVLGVSALHIWDMNTANASDAPAGTSTENASFGHTQAGVGAGACLSWLGSWYAWYGTVMSWRPHYASALAALRAVLRACVQDLLCYLRELVKPLLWKSLVNGTHCLTCVDQVLTTAMLLVVMGLQLLLETYTLNMKPYTLNMKPRKSKCLQFPKLDEQNTRNWQRFLLVYSVWCKCNVPLAVWFCLECVYYVSSLAQIHSSWPAMRTVELAIALQHDQAFARHDAQYRDCALLVLFVTRLESLRSPPLLNCLSPNFDVGNVHKVRNLALWYYAILMPLGAIHAVCGMFLVWWGASLPAPIIQGIWLQGVVVEDKKSESEDIKVSKYREVTDQLCTKLAEKMHSNMCTLLWWSGILLVMHCAGQLGWLDPSSTFFEVVRVLLVTYMSATQPWPHVQEQDRTCLLAVFLMQSLTVLIKANDYTHYTNACWWFGGIAMMMQWTEARRWLKGTMKRAWQNTFAMGWDCGISDDRMHQGLTVGLVVVCLQMGIYLEINICATGITVCVVSFIFNEYNLWLALSRSMASLVSVSRNLCLRFSRSATMACLVWVSIKIFVAAVFICMLGLAFILCMFMQKAVYSYLGCAVQCPLKNQIL